MTAIFSWMTFRDEPTNRPDMYLGRSGERWAIEADRCTRVDASPINRDGGQHVRELMTTEPRCAKCHRFHDEFYTRMGFSSPCPPRDSRLTVAGIRNTSTGGETDV